MAARKLGSRTIHEPYTALLASRALITKPKPCVLVKNGNHAVELDGAASSLGPASSISPVPAGAWLSLTDAGHSSPSILIYSTYHIVSSVQSQALDHLEHGFWDAGRGSGHHAQRAICRCHRAEVPWETETTIHIIIKQHLSTVGTALQHLNCAVLAWASGATWWALCGSFGAAWRGPLESVTCGLCILYFKSH